MNANDGSRGGKRIVSWTMLQGPLLVAVGYYVAAEAAFLIGTLSDKIFAPFWPPNVVLFCALLLTPYSRWWLYFAFTFVAHTIAEVGVGMPADQLLVAFATNCIVAVLNAVTVRHLIAGPPWFDELGKAWRYIALTAGLNPAIAAFGGAFVPIFGGGAIENYWSYWGHWYAANALACLTLGPIILVWCSEGEVRLRFEIGRAGVNAIAAGLLLVVVSLVAFDVGSSISVRAFLPALLCAPLPVILWMAVRFGARGACAAILIVTVVLISHILRGPNPFIGDDPESNVLAVQLFLTGLSIPMLLLGAVVDELRRAEVTMRDLAHTVLRERDEERRSVARDLHESTSQNLVYASMLMGKIQQLLPETGQAAAKQIEDVIRDSVSDLRAVSYLLHPPLLDEAGLPVALRNYVNGYSRTNQLAVQVDVADDIERLPGDVELTLFRVVQEALALFGRHSVGRTACIRLRRDRAARDVVVLSVQYDGRPSARRKRLPAMMRAKLRTDAASRVPMTGIRERLIQIGGRLEVVTAAQGTIVGVSAIVPIAGIGATLGA